MSVSGWSDDASPLVTRLQTDFGSLDVYSAKSSEFRYFAAMRHDPTTVAKRRILPQTRRHMLEQAILLPPITRSA